ncbi:hypothetical protein ABPG77_001731 [Micractinium sp. CCAP 211/92]
MGYMVRLGLWGEGNPAFKDFPRFLEVVQGKSGAASGANMAALELVAMDMKAQGMYVCRTLSFAGAEFEVVEAPLEEPIASQYAQAAAAWSKLFREFLAAEEVVVAEGSRAPSGVTEGEGGGRGGRRAADTRTTWRSFWAAHQAFFRHMTMAAKVPAVVRMARAAVASGRCAVIGLQSTGEARTSDVVAEKGEELDDFVSGPKELICRLVENYYPLPPDPDAEDEEAGSDSDEDFEVAAVTDAVARNVLEGRSQTFRGAKARTIRYKEFSDSEEIGDSASSSGGESSSASDSSSDEEEMAGAAEKGSSGRKVGRPGVKSATPLRRTQASSRSGQNGNSSKHGGSGVGKASRQAPVRGRGRGRASKASGGGTATGPSSSPSSSSSEVSSSEGSSSSSDGSEGSASGDDSSDEYDPTRGNGPPSSSTTSSSSGGGSKGGSLTTQQREERREARRLAAESRRLQRERAAQAYQAALKRRQELLAEVQQLELPMNPLDTLIDQLGGPAAVAEMTGRKGRLVRSKSSAGVVYQMRNAEGVAAGATLEMINVHERELFLGGTKLVAIISEAASTGISLHADRRCANQRRRVHLTLELPWSADKAIQQFGRTHRANQTHGPQYRLLFTPLGGERRFAAAVARRLESLGALTQGDRRAGPSLSAYNYESVWGQRALREMYLAIIGERRAPLALPPACRPGPQGEPPAVALPTFLGRARALLLNAGVIRHNKSVVSASHISDFLGRPEGAPPSVGRIEEKDMGDVPRFLNRLLGMEPAAQQALFDFYQATLDALMERAKREGALDEGIMDIKAHSVALVGEPRVLRRDATTGASTVIYEVELDRGLPWQDALQLLEAHQQKDALAAAGLASPVAAAAVPAVLASVPAPEGEGGAAAEVKEAREQAEFKQEEQQAAAAGAEGKGEQQQGLPKVKAEVEEKPTAAGGQSEQERAAPAKPAQQQRRQRRQQKQQPVVKEGKPGEESTERAEQQHSGQQQSDQQPTAGALPAKQEQQEKQDTSSAKRRISPRHANGLSPAGTARKGKRQRQQQDDGEQPGSSAAAAGGAEPAAVATATAAAVPAVAEKRLATKRRRASDSPAGTPVKPEQTQPAAQQARAEPVDASLSDSRGETALSPAADAAGPSAGEPPELPAEKQQQRQQEQPSPPEREPQHQQQPDSGSDVIVLLDSDEEEEGSGQAGKGGTRDGASGPQRWRSGFFRARQEGINRQVHVLLALQVEGSQPPIFHIHRPATGRSRQNMSLQELKARYAPLEPAACQSLWEKAYEAADTRQGKEGGEKKPAVARKKRLHVLGGAVMRSWGAVQAALAKHVKPSERRMRVLRIATTGDSLQRLVGMLVPEPAVEPVIQVLQGSDEQAAPTAGGDSTGSGAAGAAQPAAKQGRPPQPRSASQQRKKGARGVEPPTTKRARVEKQAQQQQQQPSSASVGTASDSDKAEPEAQQEQQAAEAAQQQQPRGRRKPPARGQPPQRRQPPRGRAGGKAASSAAAPTAGTTSSAGTSSSPTSSSSEASSSSSDSEDEASLPEAKEESSSSTSSSSAEEEEEEVESSTSSEDAAPPPKPTPRRRLPMRGAGARGRKG